MYYLKLVWSPIRDSKPTLSGLLWLAWADLEATEATTMIHPSNE